MPSYTFSETLIGWDGATESVADATIFNLDTSGSNIEIATSDSTAALSYTLAVRSEVNERTSAVNYMSFSAHLFTYTA